MINHVLCTTETCDNSTCASELELFVEHHGAKVLVNNASSNRVATLEEVCTSFRNYFRFLSERLPIPSKNMKNIID